MYIANLEAVRHDMWVAEQPVSVPSLPVLAPIVALSISRSAARQN